MFNIVKTHRDGTLMFLAIDDHSMQYWRGMDDTTLVTDLTERDATAIIDIMNHAFSGEYFYYNGNADFMAINTPIHVLGLPKAYGNVIMFPCIMVYDNLNLQYWIAWNDLSMNQVSKESAE